MTVKNDPPQLGDLLKCIHRESSSANVAIVLYNGIEKVDVPYAFDARGADIIIYELAG